MLGKKEQKINNRSTEGPRQLTSTHTLLREINNVIDFNFFTKRVAPYFNPIGRKSIDPVVILKMMILGYIFGLRSDRMITEECIDRLSYREFLGYTEIEDLPAHTNFSNWRKKLGPEVFEESIKDILSQCEAAGIRLGNARLFDSSRIQSKAATYSSAKVEVEFDENPDEYLDAFSWQTGYEDPKDDPKYGEKLVVNTNDPEAKLLRYENEPAKFIHKVHIEVDSKTGLVVNTAVSHKTEHEMMLNFLREENRHVISACADSGYSSIGTYKELEGMCIKAYIPFRDHANDKGKKYHLRDFTYKKDDNTYTCPNVKIMKQYHRDSKKRRIGYRADKKDCIACPLRDKCINKKTRCRTLTVSDDRPYIEKIKLSNMKPAHKRMMNRRKTIIEGTFGHAKAWCGMRTAKGIGSAAMRIQLALTAMIINIKKLVAHIRNKRQGQTVGNRSKISVLLSLKRLFEGIIDLFTSHIGSWSGIYLSRCILIPRASIC